jgi:hypothetical protein
VLRKVQILGAVLVVVGLTGLIWSVTHLSGGIADLPGHWWSTLALLPLVVGVTLLVWTWTLRART